MSNTTTTLTSGELVKLVRDVLGPLQPRDYTLQVLEQGIRQEDDWWYVVVQPDRTDIRSYDYYDKLAQAEATLQDERHLNVLLVPTLPG